MRNNTLKTKLYNDKVRALFMEKMGMKVAYYNDLTNPTKSTKRRLIFKLIDDKPGRGSSYLNFITGDKKLLQEIVDELGDGWLVFDNPRFRCTPNEGHAFGIKKYID